MESKIKTGYKVVFFEDQKFTSFIICRNEVEYFLNKKTYPSKNCGPLCVFKRLGYVKEYLIYYEKSDNIKVFKCKYRESEEDRVWDSEEKSDLKKDLPSGTRLADWVQLIEEVTL